MAPELEQKIVGIRPGEKLHEVMCPGEICYSTYEYPDHFVIAPAIKFSSRSNDFTQNALNEKGKAVEDGYEYNSFSNSDYMSVEQIKVFNFEAME